ncbi:MAG TPA: DnaA/Hda family protein [Rhodoblastus sp.]|nr:DnaA/Hda family protein [Rhodoblastus sp.]
MSAAGPDGGARPGARQLAFEFAPQPRFGDDDFLIAPSNAAAHALVHAWPAWPDPVLALIGAKGAGKSHLAAIWARRARAVLVPPGAVSAEADLGDFYGRNILLEDAESVGDEQGLFHLFNLVQESRAAMLMTAKAEPKLWSVRLPDLRSRLRRAPVAHIEPPTDDLVRAVLVKLFDDRQLAVEANVIDYIALRIDRSLDAAREIVAALDAEALARGRAVGRGLAADVIGKLATDEEV